MKRGLTGLLAWSALALVIAVPSTEMWLTRPDNGANETKVFVGPQPTDAAIGPINKPAEGPVSVAATNADDLPFQPARDQVRVVLPAYSKALPLPPIVPAGAPKKAVAKLPEAVVEQPKVNQPEPVVEVAAKAAPVDPVEPEYVGAESLIVANAPVPMPAPERPLEPVGFTPLQAPQTQLEQDVSTSIATVRTTVRQAPQLRGDALAPDNSRFWGDDPRYRGRQNLQAFDPDDASDSSFYELWQAENRPVGFQRRGSFEEQLPARRGSAVRLDLLQR